MMNEIPKIDLYNFEDEKFRECRYVLTSPRSLEACARLNIEPIDLLKKSKDEFVEKFQNFPPKKIEQLFIYHENRREARLTRARYERSRMGNENTATMGEPIGPLPDSASVCEQNAAKNTSLDAIAPKYEELLRKLPPAEAKRLKLAYLRCRQLAQQRGDAKDTELIVFGHTPRPNSTHCLPVSHLDSSRTNGLLHRSSSTSSHSKDQQINSSRSAKNFERAKESELRLEQARERKKHLEGLLETYRQQLQETLEMTQQKAKERAALRLAEEQQKRVMDRRLKEDIFRERSKDLQNKQEEARIILEHSKRQKEERVQQMLHEREAKIQESRNLARAAEELREEMLRVYNLDGFDKKVKQATLVNDLRLGGTRH